MWLRGADLEGACRPLEEEVLFRSLLVHVGSDPNSLQHGSLY